MNDGTRGSTTDHTKALTDGDLVALREESRQAAARGQASLLIYHRGGVRIVSLVDGRGIVVGRSEPAEVRIKDRSLSRTHACVELKDGEVWIEDLGSTNGTWIASDRIERARVEPGVELRLGALAAAVQPLAPFESRQFGQFGHEAFLHDVEAEAIRARVFGRNLALLMLRCESGEGFGGWFSRLRGQLRPFDRVALYSSNTVEVLLPEATEADATSRARTLMRGHHGVSCGIGVIPTHAGSAGELVEVTHGAMLHVEPGQRVNVARAVTSASADPPSAAPTGDRIVQSPAMEKLYVTARKIASSVIPVLILGETGTGKEVLARAIHGDGKRAGKPFIAVNCAAIPSQLVESTLFGHEKGSFTGATQQAKGVFESADGGTVLLDEVGELPASAQAALLRVLESKCFSRVGSTREISVNVRVLGATHRNLASMVEKGDFREDLLYRLNTMTLTIPPLRERLEEIEPLVELFIGQANRANELDVAGVTASAIRLMRRYTWPGNVRELRNVVERAVVIAAEERITPEDLPESMQALGGGESRPSTSRSVPGEATFSDIPTLTPTLEPDAGLKDQLAQVEAQMIRAALDQARWYRKKAADQLGIPLRTLAHKMKVYGITRD